MSNIISFEDKKEDKELIELLEQFEKHMPTKEELEARRTKWQPREPKVTTGYLKRYASLVTSGNRGAVLEIKDEK